MKSRTKRTGLAVGKIGPLAALSIALTVASFSNRAMGQQCTHPQGALSIAVLGDVNQSGQTNVADAFCVLLAVHAGQNNTPPASVGCLLAEWRTADLSCDASIDLVDLQACIHLSLGMGLPAGLNPDVTGCAAACAPCNAPGQSSCLIGGTCYPEGSRQGAGDCQVCAPATDAAQWTNETCTAWYADGDGDNFGSNTSSSCRCVADSTYVLQSAGDCDDLSPAINPAATEVCDSVDNDCDGTTDEGFLWQGTEVGAACDGVAACGAGVVECDGASAARCSTDPGASADESEPEVCDTLDNNCDGTVDEGCAQATTCLQILNSAPGSPSGEYLIDPDGAGGNAPFLAYCDMTSDGGGWTKLMSAQWSHFFSATTWQDFNSATPMHANYSALSRRSGFYAVPSGCASWRLTVGNSGNWLAGPQAHYTNWQQCHDPFLASTNGSDFTYLGGELSTTCGGFNGLHNKYQGYSFTTDADLNDNVGCWWQQIVPSVNYDGMGYLEGYGGVFNYHQWQALWIRESALGTVPTNPAVSCLAIHQTTPSLPSGTYWLDPGGPGGAAPFQVFCDMVTADGGWTLISNRRAHATNSDSCGGRVATFFTNGCGAPTAIGPNDSYALSAAQRNSVPKVEMLVLQYLNGTPDTDDAYIVTLGSLLDPFPNNTTSWVTTAVPSVRDFGSNLVDSSGVYWVYTGDSWYHSSLCDGGFANDTSHSGNYGLCHNGLGNYPSSSFVGDRSQYSETKLWAHPNIAGNYQERIFYR